MITVSILINGQPIYTRTAVNMGHSKEISTGGNKRCRYRLDSSEEINHYPGDGAVKLAKKMLDTIEEIK